MEKIQLENLTNEQISFQLILHSGNARSKVMQALREYREGTVSESDSLIVQAEQDLSVRMIFIFKWCRKRLKEKK